MWNYLLFHDTLTVFAFYIGKYILPKMGVLAVTAVTSKHSMQDFSPEKRLVTAVRDTSQKHCPSLK